MVAKKPRVFISYAHEGKELRSKVLELSETLRDWGLITIVDLYVVEPPGGWRRWMNTEIQSADFVLVVCTPLYKKRVEEPEGNGKGLGSAWEGAIIFQQIYESARLESKVIPVIFSSAHSKNIPVDLRHKNYYYIGGADGIEKVFRRITNQPEIVPGKVSEKLRVFEPIKRSDSEIVGQDEEEAPRNQAHSRKKSVRSIRKSGDSRKRRRNEGVRGGIVERTNDFLPEAGVQISPSMPRMLDFEPGTLDRSTISLPLLRQLNQDLHRRVGRSDVVRLYDVVIEMNRLFPGFPDATRRRVNTLIRESMKVAGNGKARMKGPAEQGVDEAKSSLSRHYVFARLSGEVLRQMVAKDRSLANFTDSPLEAIHRVWPDFQIRACQKGEGPAHPGKRPVFLKEQSGKGVLWAVIDSGIDAQHPQFQKHGNLNVRVPGGHRDFTSVDGATGSPLTDEFGHGTGIAGLIAGEVSALDGSILYSEKLRDETGHLHYKVAGMTYARGMAPECGLLSLKVLDADGGGTTSDVIVALEHVNRLNEFGKKILVHGVTIGLGYDFDPEWYATGLSPLCNEVDNLVRSGVVVIVPAGNTGYAYFNDPFRGPSVSGVSSSINDPGNADLAITVGSTHAELPEVYGVSFFSAKGPTSDGRRKPDMVAPGEKMTICAVGRPREELRIEIGKETMYRQSSGTSYSAAYVSGMVASFLSAKPRYKGKALETKAVFLASCKDIGRVESHQGHGLVNLRKALEIAGDGALGRK